MSLVNSVSSVIQEQLRTFRQLPNDPERGSSPRTIDEMLPAYRPEFPHNTVIHAGESGNFIEVDDTHSAERIHVFHRSGAHIEMRPDGSVKYKSTNKRQDITVGDHDIVVRGDFNITVDGATKLYVRNGSLEIQADHGAAVNVKGELKLHADNILMKAKNKITLGAPFIDFGEPVPYMTLPMGVATLMGVTVPMVMLPGLAATSSIPSPGSGTSIAAIAATATSVAAMATQMNTFKSFAGNIQKGITLVKSARGADGEPIVPEIDQPEEIPLANPLVYRSKAVPSVDVRTRMFDTPEDVGDTETYTAHLSICEELGDFTPDVKQLPGQLVSTDTTNPAPEPLPSTVFSQTGMVTCVQGSETVLGTGTAFTTDLVNGQSLLIAGQTVKVVAIENDTSLVLSEPWSYPGVSDMGYEAYMLRPFKEYFNTYDYGFDVRLGVSSLVLRDLCGTSNLVSVRAATTVVANTSSQSNLSTGVDLPAAPSELTGGSSAARYVRSSE